MHQINIPDLGLTNVGERTAELVGGREEGTVIPKRFSSSLVILRANSWMNLHFWTYFIIYHCIKVFVV